MSQTLQPLSLIQFFINLPRAAQAVAQNRQGPVAYNNIVVMAVSDVHRESTENSVRSGSKVWVRRMLPGSVVAINRTVTAVTDIRCGI